MTLLKDVLWSEAQEMMDELISIRRHIHKNPELGLEVYETRDFVEKKLQEFGYDVTRVGQAGLTTTIGNGEGKVFLLRADMDALPIVEDNDLDYKSTIEGKMHACGHDIHTTMLLGAAKLLQKHKDSIPGTIKFMFQPAEELLLGAKDMLEHGILENPKPDAALMVHVAPGYPLDVGSLILMPHGPAMASSDWFEINIEGKGGHGSTPYLTYDPTIPMNLIFQAIQAIQSRELPPNSLTTITVGDIRGAVTSNVIAGSVAMGGTIRSYNEEHRQFIKDRMVQIVEGISTAMRCKGSVTFPAGVPFFDSSEKVSNVANEVLGKYIPDLTLIPPMKQDIPTMGSEDFALISQIIPATSINIAASDSRKGGVYGVHHPKVVFDEACIPYGVVAYVATALNWLDQNK